MIWGYDIDIPEYVKYRNGDDFVYVRSVQDVSSDWNVAGSLVEEFVGKEIFECSWNSESYKREYSAINTVKSVSDEKFTYGNNCTYSVPQKITDNDGKTYTFCGHTATLHSKNLVTSTNDNGTTMIDHEYFNSKWTNRYIYSMYRQYVNSRVGYSEFNPPSECGDKADYIVEGTGKHYTSLGASANGFLTKFFNDIDFMKTTTRQVNRVWNFSDQDNPDICIDDVGLIPVGEMGYTPSDLPTAYDTSIQSLYSSEETDEHRVKYKMNIDGTNSTFGSWWLRSAQNEHKEYAGASYTGGKIISKMQCYGDLVCCSPLVLIG